MKLEAVMENLQRQQAARLALEEKLRQAEREKDARLQQQATAFRHYPPVAQSAFPPPALAEPYAGSGGAHHRAQHAARRRPSRGSDADEEPERERDAEDDERDIEEDELEDARRAAAESPYCKPAAQAAAEQRKSAAQGLSRGGQLTYPAAGRCESPAGGASHGQQPQHEWTYEEQFKQPCTRTSPK